MQHYKKIKITDRPLKICLIYPGFPPENLFSGGIGTFVYYFAKFLLQNNFIVTILSRSSKVKQIKKECIDNIVVYRIPENKFCGSGSFFVRGGAKQYSIKLSEFFFLLEKKEPPFDIIEIGDWGGEGWSIIKTNSSRTVIRCHTPGFIAQLYNPSNLPYLDKSVLELEKEVISEATNICSSSHELMRRIKLILGKDVNYDYQPLYFLSAIRKKIFVKNEYRCSAIFRIVVVGRVEERKGIKIFFEALNRLRLDNVAFSLTWFGPDTMRRDGSSMKEWILKQYPELRDSCHFFGPVKHDWLLQQYVNYDVFVMPSIFESWGLSAMEALLSGLPLIISAECELSKFLHNGEDALIYEANDPDDLKDNLIKLINNRALAKKIALNGKKYMERRLTDQKIQRNIVSYYEKIVNK